MWEHDGKIICLDGFHRVKVLAGKVAAGVNAREVLAKELSLAGVQRPLAQHELPGAVEIFRFGDFAGWIIE